MNRGHPAAGWGRGPARGSGIGAGAGQRRRRPRAPAPGGEAARSQGPTWLSLSLDDGASEPTASSATGSLIGIVSLDESDGGAEVGVAAHLLVIRQPPEAAPPSFFPEPPTDIGDHSTADEPGPARTATLGGTAEELTARSGVVRPEGPEEGQDKAEPTAAPQSSSSRRQPEAAPPEEDTEALEAPVPAPIRVALLDEPLPFPALLVRPTIVLPGAWPPPLSPRSDASEPSGVRPVASGSRVEELALDAPGEHSAELVVRPSDERSDEVSLVIDDSMADVSVEEASLTDALNSSAPRAIRIDEPPVHGTLDQLPVVKRARPIAPPDADDEIPTEVSQKDALEAALAALRVSEPAVLSLAADPWAPRGLESDEVGDDALPTHDDLVSLELVDSSDVLHVDAAVLADLMAAERTPHPGDSSPVHVVVLGPTTERGEGPRVFVGLGQPTIAPPRRPQVFAHPTPLGPRVDDSLEPELLLRDGDSEPEVLSLSSIADQPAPTPPERPSPIQVDLGLGSLEAPDRESARKGVAVAPPRPVRASDGAPQSPVGERRTDLVALARGIEPVLPSSSIAEDDDWLAELPESTSAAPPGVAPPSPVPESAGPMSPHYEDTLPGWLPEARGARSGPTRGGPDEGRPPTLAPMAPAAPDDDDLPD